MPMACIVAILMYPVFVQDLYYRHMFNAVALTEIAKIFLMWMGAALSIQCLHDFLFCKKNGWNVWGPLYMGLCVSIASAPWNTIGSVTLILVTSAMMYEIGCHSLQLIKEETIYVNNYEKLEILKPLHSASYVIIIVGILIAFYIAMHTGHLL